MADGVCSLCGYEVMYIPDAQSPVLEPISSTPDSPITAGTEVTFSTSVSDDVKLAKIELFIDDELKKTETVSGLSGTISYATSTLTIGEHTVKVVATDAAGLTNSVSLTVTVQKAESGSCAHKNTTTIRTQEYVPVDAEHHQLVFTDWTHCLDCDTGLSNTQEKNLPEKHEWEEGVCKVCKYACAHDEFQDIYLENGNHKAENGVWESKGEIGHWCSSIEYWEKCIHCGIEQKYVKADPYHGEIQEHMLNRVIKTYYQYDENEHWVIGEDRRCTARGCVYVAYVLVGESQREEHQYVNGICACSQKEKVTSSGTMNNSSSVINENSSEIVDVSDFGFEINDGYYYPDRKMLIVHDNKVKAEVRDQYTKRIVNVSELDYVKVELEVMIGEVEYQDGYIYITSDGLKQVNVGVLRLIDVRDGSFIDEIYVGSCIAGNADAEAYMTLDALVKHSNKKVWAGEQGTQIAEMIKVFDTEYQYKNDKPVQYPDGYYEVKLDAYNSSPLIYGVRVYNADGTMRDGIHFIGGYAQNISLWRQGKEIGSSVWENISDNRWGEFTGETEIMRQKTELCINVPVGGAIEFVQVSEDDEVYWMNMLNVFLSTYAFVSVSEDFVIPSVDAGSVIDVNKVSGILSAAAKEEITGIISDAVMSGSVPALIEEWCQKDEKPEYVKELFKALGEGVVSGAIDEAEEWLEFFILPPAYVIMEGGDVAAKGLNMTSIGVEINQQIQYNKDYVYTDYIFTPYYH